MGALLVITFFTVGSWALLSLVCHFRRNRVGYWWWCALGLLGIVGIAAGVWGGFFFEYHLGARYRFASFPLPVVVFHLEDGEWVDFPVPKVQAWASALTDVISITALATFPLWLVSWLQHRHEHKTG